MARLPLPWTRSEAADDPYWDVFLNRAPADPQNMVPHLIRQMPDGAINPVPEEIHSPEINASHIKELARFLGTDLVGIARLEGDPEGFPFAVVNVVRADQDPREHPGVGGQVPVQNGQYVTFVLSAYIRELGFRSTVHGDAAPQEHAERVRLAAKAGLGTVDAEGRLVTPQYGARVYVADIIRTDLPLAADG
jgi:hypothetical protein